MIYPRNIQVEKEQICTTVSLTLRAGSKFQISAFDNTIFSLWTSLDPLAESMLVPRTVQVWRIFAHNRFFVNVIYSLGNNEEWSAQAGKNKLPFPFSWPVQTDLSRRPVLAYLSPGWTVLVELFPADLSRLTCPCWLVPSVLPGWSVQADVSRLTHLGWPGQDCQCWPIQT